MALTPEDVVNKRFQPTKFREGYDQDEVDDFLDEVVAELRRLTQENDELRQRLVAGESRISELQSSGTAAPASAPAAEAPASVPAPASAPVAEQAPEPVSVPQPAAAAAVAPAAPAYVGPTADETESTNNLLQLARRLHEEHVREGVEKRDALIAEGHSTAARVVAEAEAKNRELVSEGETKNRELISEGEAKNRELISEGENRARDLVQTAEAEKRETLEKLNTERSGLERRIDDLRTFERDYRQKLKSYIEGQLRDLDGESNEQPAGAPASAQGFGSN
ncbi:DivIVA domain-containing protein [Frigoribacterium faeni]|nr:DivIVA domain-containing protein [Frigoribacterium faeni]MBA8812994.1 DivIVA domain-containing protein [Frigoribacterium faeni]